MHVDLHTAGNCMQILYIFGGESRKEGLILDEDLDVWRRENTRKFLSLEPNVIGTSQKPTDA